MTVELNVLHRMVRFMMGYKGSMAINPKGRANTDVDKTDGKVDWDPIALLPEGYSRYNVPKGALKHFHYNKVVPYFDQIGRYTFWDERRLGKMTHDKDGKRIVPKTPEEAIANGADPKVVRAWGRYFNECFDNAVPDHAVRLDIIKATTKTAGRVPINPEFIPVDDSAHFGDLLGVTLNINRYTVQSYNSGSWGNLGYIRGAKTAFIAFLFVLAWHIHNVEHRFPLILDWKIIDNAHHVAERERRMVRDGLNYEDVFRPSKVVADDDE